METNSNVYDKSISHESQAALLNACWGNLLLGEGKGDSARYFFSRGLEMSNDDNSKLVNLKGMYDSFLFSDNRDSIAKYAILYSNVNDSIHASLSTQSMQRIKSQYVFRQYERMAENEKRKSMSLELFLLSVVLAVTVVLFLAYHLLTRYKRKKEKEMETLREKLSLLRGNDGMAEQWTLEQTMLNSPVITELHEQASKTSKPSRAQWVDLLSLAERELPLLYKKLASSEPPLTDQEMIAALLIRLQFTQGELASLLGVSKQRVNNIKRNINKKIFQQEGAVTLNGNIFSI